jgi:hypothetical protein
MLQRSRHRAAKRVVDKGASIDLNWVPEHQDILGNEKADELAKRASQKDPPNAQTVSYSYLRQKAKSETTSQWREALRGEKQPSAYSKLFEWRIRAKTLLPKGTKRELASSFYQLKFGHGYLRAYLAKLGHLEDDRCSCGGKETPEHLLLSCRDLRDQQKELRESLGCRASLRVLLHTKTGVEKTLEFLKNIKVATRKRLLQRQEREEREGRRRRGRRRRIRRENVFHLVIQTRARPSIPLRIYRLPPFIKMYLEMRGL